jgi:hypothetical protein
VEGRESTTSELHRGTSQILNFGEKCCLEQLLNTHGRADNSASIAGDRHSRSAATGVLTSTRLSLLCQPPTTVALTSATHRW